MIELPDELRAAISPASGLTVLRWWAALTEADQRQVVALWDHRLEAHFFEPQTDEAGRLDHWNQIPRVRGGRFVPHDDAWGLAEWGPEYFEYLLAHPEFFPILDPEFRTLHIGCTRHAEARACRDSGQVPRDFTCPAASASCPLRSLRGARLVLPRGGIKATHPTGDRRGLEWPP